MKDNISFITIGNIEKDFYVFNWYLFMAKGHNWVGIHVNESDPKISCFTVSKTEYDRLWDIKTNYNKDDKKCSFCDGTGI